MSLKRAIMLLFMAMLIASCSNTDTKDQPTKPASVYKDPQVKITHAPPTEVIVNVPSLEATALATEIVGSTTQNDAPEVTNEATEEAIDQALMNEIEYLLNKIETDLERMDTNP